MDFRRTWVARPWLPLERASARTMNYICSHVIGEGPRTIKVMRNRGYIDFKGRQSRRDDDRTNMSLPEAMTPMSQHDEA